MTPTLLRGAFAPFGNIIDLSMDPPRNCAFVTYEKMESADQAVAELNGTQVESVQLKVSIARKQPMLDAATGKSVWGSLGKNRFFLLHPIPHSSLLPFVPLHVP